MTLYRYQLSLTSRAEFILSLFLSLSDITISLLKIQTLAYKCNALDFI